MLCPAQQGSAQLHLLGDRGGPERWKKVSGYMKELSFHRGDWYTEGYNCQGHSTPLLVVPDVTIVSRLSGEKA